MSDDRTHQDRLRSALFSDGKIPESLKKDGDGEAGMKVPVRPSATFAASAIPRRQWSFGSGLATACGFRTRG